MRKPTRRILFALIIGLAISAAAGAADKSGNYTTFGAGNNTCESWLKERGKGEPRAWQLQQWLLGYVSGAESQPKTLSPPRHPPPRPGP